MVLKVYCDQAEGEEEPKPKTIPAMIMEHPSFILELSDNHSLEEIDLALRVRSKRNTEPVTFLSRVAANEAYVESETRLYSVAMAFDPQLAEFKRKVDAVCEFHADSNPSNPVAVVRDAWEPVPESLVLHTSLHQDLAWPGLLSHCAMWCGELGGETGESVPGRHNQIGG